MREVVGNIFEIQADCIVIPTNTEITYTFSRVEPRTVMGAGLARLAVQREGDHLPFELAARMLAYGREHIYVFNRGYLEESRYLACLPTKRDWSKPSDGDLIRHMLVELVAVANAMGWETIAVPRLGCGLGGLSWPNEVRPMLKLWLDDRFVVVDLKGD